MECDCAVGEVTAAMVVLTTSRGCELPSPGSELDVRVNERDVGGLDVGGVGELDVGVRVVRARRWRWRSNVCRFRRWRG